MFTWLLFASLFCMSTQHRNEKHNGVTQCGPQNVNGTHNSEHMILVTWEDAASCSAVHDVLTYELQLLRAEEPLHYDEVVVTADQIGSTHSWSWSPPWALECASHSVRVRSRYRNHTSPWSRVQAVPETRSSNQPMVYPVDRAFEVGSRFTFCCILEPGGRFNKMYITGPGGTQVNTSKISNQTYGLTVDLHTPNEVCHTDVRCNNDAYGTCVYVGYPPAVRDLKCETRDLMSVECQWSVERDTHLSIRSPTAYHLLGRPCSDRESKSSECRCKQDVEVNVGDRNWTLRAQNALGMMELTEQADLTKRVHMFAPEDVTASAVSARNVSVEWRWRIHKYNEMDILCETELSHGEQTHTRNFSGVGLHFAVLDGLIPNQVYAVKVRCGTKQHFWKWSDSSTSTFQTRGDIPDALDVWMRMENKQTIIVWKTLLANQSHGEIKDYEVTWRKSTDRETQSSRKISAPEHCVNLSLNTSEEHFVAVTARNMNGSSSPSVITIPRLYPDRVMNASKITGTDGGFSMTWPAHPAASCGYVVDWRPSSSNCSIEWLKVPPGGTSAKILSKNFTDGVRYSLSIYACTQGAPQLLERREGYVREKKILHQLFQGLKWEQRGSDVEVSWPAISLQSQSAFIQGYIMYYTDNSAHGPEVFSDRTDNPEATSLTATKLQISSYTFTVKALTSLGECGNTSLSLTMKPSTDNLIMVLIISLVSVFTLFSLITILCYRHWACVKQKVYPPIPKPVLTDNWLSSLGKQSHLELHTDSCHHSEIDTVVVPELYCKLAAVTADISQDEGLCVATQTPSPKGYCNQPLRKFSPAAFTSSSRSSSSPFRGMLENPSYNVPLQTDERSMQWCEEKLPSVALLSPSSHELQELTSSAGYQPQI